MKDEIRYTLSQKRKELRLILIEIEAIQEVISNSQLSEARMHIIHALECLTNVHID